MLNTNTKQSTQSSGTMHTGYLALFLLAVVEISILIWTAYDHSIPCWDTAAHKVNSYTVFELLSHPHLKHLNWYQSIFGVSQLYPPLFYIISALIKFPFGEMSNTELIANLLFIAILFYSLYYITKVTYKNELAALIAPVLVFLYPGVYWSCHSALLDCPANAAVAAGLAAFFWWSQYPQLRRSIILGLILGLATLTKNNVPIFFIGPILADLYFSLKKQNNNRPDYKRIGLLLITGLIAFIVILPWLILAGAAVSKFILSIQQQNFSANSYVAYANPIPATERFAGLTEFLTHLNWFTLQDLPLILSPILCAGFVFALFIQIITRTKPLAKNTIYLLASLVFSLLIASAFRWPHQFRYIVPAAIPIASLTAGIIAQLWLTPNIFLRLILSTLALITCLQFTYVSFSPYPIALPTFIKEIALKSGSNFKEKLSIGQMPGISISPLPDSDSAIIWSLSQIESANPKKPTSVMIMPSGDPINCSPYFYLAKIRKDNIDVASPRQHTELGDKVSFNQSQASWYKWYILKSGDQGIAFCDNESSTEYAKWLEFVHGSKLYKLVSKKPLPDGSTLELYGPIKD